MPGLCGCIKLSEDPSTQDLFPMVKALSYAKANVVETFEEEGLGIGCVHLGTGGQRALYQSAQCVVIFFGYLTRPSIPLGVYGIEPAAAARHIHDRYLVCGEKVVNELGGAFAFVLWNRKTRSLLLATDKLGLRPIYCATHVGTFYFASEIKAILADPTFPRRLDRAAIADLFSYSFILEEKTLFEDIQLLPPASLMCIEKEQPRMSCYWDITFPDTYPRQLDRWYDDLIYTDLKSAVKRMVHPALEYGLSLSGGLDSRWIAGLLSQCHPESLAFTLSTPGSDDTPLAKEVAARTGLQHKVWEIPPTFLAEEAETYSYITEGMDNLLHIDEFPLTLRIGNYVDVSVGGFLGDGLFGYEINPLSARLRKQDVTPYRFWRTKGSRLAQPQMVQVFGERTAYELTELAMDSLRRSFTAAPTDRGFQALQYFDLRQAERRMTMVAQMAKLPFVDIYHPIADEEVILAALQLPVGQLILERAYRRAMATHLPDLAGIPWTFTLTPPTISIPGIVLKKGMQFTLGKWLRNTSLGRHPLIRTRRYYVDYPSWIRGSLRPFIESTLLSPELEALGLFNPEGLRAVMNDHMQGRISVISFLGNALAMAKWAQLFYLPSTLTLPSSLDGD